MRRDMHRVIITPPRSSDGHDRDPNVSRDWGRMPMRREHQAKWKNDHLGPLRRFLRTRVGRQWDDVLAEIRENHRRWSVLNAHLVDHVEHLVATARVIDGRLHLIRFGQPEPLEGQSDRFFACPLTGRLGYVAPRPRRRKTAPIFK
ncbi:MAG: hypothetical protein AAF533_10735 [Acidobacteriota bacterium]